MWEVYNSRKKETENKVAALHVIRLQSADEETVCLLAPMEQASQKSLQTEVGAVNREGAHLIEELPQEEDAGINETPFSHPAKWF